MTYVPTRIVRLAHGTLHESHDLTVTLGSLLGTNSFLVVEQDYEYFPLDLGQIILFESNLSLTAPVSTALNSRLSDAFIVRYGKDGLPITNHHGTYEKRLKVLNPMAYKDYKVQFTSMQTPTILDDVSKKGFLDDLVITTKEDLSQALVAVNGVFHRTTVNDGKLYVHDGFRTMRISDRKDMTFVNTAALGGHMVVPITTSNCTLANFNDSAKITSPVSLKNKTVFLVIDGYFYHANSDVFYHVSDTTLKVRTNKLALIHQFRENPRTMIVKDRYGPDASQTSRKYADAYAALFLGKRQIPTSQLATRDFQYSRLTHYHSFLVVMNNPDLFTVTSEILPTGSPQFYSEPSAQVLSGMMSYGSGLCPSYVILKDPFKRKSVFIPPMPKSYDWRRETISPQFIPSLLGDVQEPQQISARFVDYVTA